MYFYGNAPNWSIGVTRKAGWSEGGVAMIYDILGWWKSGNCLHIKTSVLLRENLKTDALRWGDTLIVTTVFAAMGKRKGYHSVKRGDRGGQPVKIQGRCPWPIFECYQVTQGCPQELAAAFFCRLQGCGLPAMRPEWKQTSRTYVAFKLSMHWQ